MLATEANRPPGPWSSEARKTPRPPSLVCQGSPVRQELSQSSALLPAATPTWKGRKPWLPVRQDLREEQLTSPPGAPHPCLLQPLCRRGEGPHLKYF